MLNEEILTEQLSGENKKRFLDFVNAWSVVNGESNLNSFARMNNIRSRATEIVNNDIIYS